MKEAPSSITLLAFGWRLDDRQVAGVVNFIRNSGGNTAKAQVSAADVTKVRKKVPEQGYADRDALNQK